MDIPCRATCLNPEEYITTQCTKIATHRMDWKASLTENPYFYCKECKNLVLHNMGKIERQNYWVQEIKNYF
jgi:hypothetical protein